LSFRKAAVGLIGYRSGKFRQTLSKLTNQKHSSILINRLITKTYSPCRRRPSNLPVRRTRTNRSWLCLGPTFQLGHEVVQCE